MPDGSKDVACVVLPAYCARLHCMLAVEEVYGLGLLRAMLRAEVCWLSCRLM